MARRVSIGNLVFRTVGALAVLPFINLLVPYLAAISGEPARMVVNFHMAFNLGLGLVFLPLTSQAGAALDRLLPDREDANDPKKTLHLDSDALDTPSLALAGASREALRIGDIVESMLADTFEALRDGNRSLRVDIAQREDVVDSLYRAIKLFVTQATRQRLSDRESLRCVEILAFTTNLEHIGDIIDTGLLEMVDKRVSRDVDFSSEGWREIEELHRHVLGDLRVALGIFLSGEVDEARRLIEEKQTVREIERRAADNHMARLRDGRVESIETSTLHLDVLRDLKRIHSHICAIAYPILDDAGQLRSSRLKRLPGNKAKKKTDTGTPS
jgi:phosphate:Na+ symporter